MKNDTGLKSSLNKKSWPRPLEPFEVRAKIAAGLAADHQFSACQRAAKRASRESGILDFRLAVARSRSSAFCTAIKEAVQWMTNGEQPGQISPWGR